MLLGLSDVIICYSVLLGDPMCYEALSSVIKCY